MGGFLEALKHGIPGGERRTAYLQQQAEEEKQRHEQGEMAQHYLGLGAKVVGDGGVVKDHLPLTEGEVDEAGNYTPGTGVPEGMLRKAGADGRHVIKLKAPGSRDIQLELPTPEESAAYHLKLGHQLLTGGAPDRAIVNAEAVQQGGALARAKGQGEAEGTFAAQQGERDRNGLSAPDWLSKIVPGANGRKYLPAEFDALISNVGKSDELRTSLDSKKTTAAMQALSSATDQPGYDSWLKANPELASSLNAPQTYSPVWVKSMIRRAVPIEKQPEFDIKQKEADMAGETGAVDWNEQADKIVNPTLEPGRNAVLKARLRTAITRVEKNKILSDVADQEGKTDTAIKTAKATAPIKIQVGSGIEAAKSAVAAQVPGGPGAELLTGEEYLSRLPAGMSATVKAISEGRRAPYTGRAAASGYGAQVMNAVGQYDPEFNEQRAQIRKAFTTGPDGRNIGALNTATVHLDQFADVAKAIGNGSFQPGNAIWNSARAMFGSSAPTNFEGLKAAVSGEMASALKGNATDIEIATIKHNIDSKNSPQQLADYVTEQLHVLGAKLNTYQERYNQQSPGDTHWSPVLPSARAVYQKHGIDPTAGPRTNVSGGGAADYVRTAAGANGHKIGQKLDGFWYDVQTGAKVQ